MQCHCTRDDVSTVNLLNNGRESSGKRARHICMRLFYVKDLIGNYEVEVKHCPTERMIADCSAKPLVGEKFKIFRDVFLIQAGFVAIRLDDRSVLDKHVCR